MKYILLSLVLLNLTLSAQAQDIAKMKSTAQLLLDATMKADYQTLLKYTYPKAIALGGGMEKMTETIKTGMKQMAASGVSFHRANLLEPGKIYKAGKELHCVLPHTIIMKIDRGYLTATGSLLCISADGGKNWTYLSAGNIGKDRIKKMLPNIHPDMVIPAQTEPTFQQAEPQ